MVSHFRLRPHGEQADRVLLTHQAPRSPGSRTHLPSSPQAPSRLPEASICPAHGGHLGLLSARAGLWRQQDPGSVPVRLHLGAGNAREGRHPARHPGSCPHAALPPPPPTSSSMPALWEGGWASHLWVRNPLHAGTRDQRPGQGPTQCCHITSYVCPLWKRVNTQAGHLASQASRRAAHPGHTRPEPVWCQLLSRRSSP